MIQWSYKILQNGSFANLYIPHTTSIECTHPFNSSAIEDQWGSFKGHFEEGMKNVLLDMRYKGGFFIQA